MSLIQDLKFDTVIGRMSEGSLQTQVSVRNGNVVLGYSNPKTRRGFEVAYSPKAMREFADMCVSAAKVAEGKVGLT